MGTPREPGDADRRRRRVMRSVPLVKSRAAAIGGALAAATIAIVALAWQSGGSDQTSIAAGPGLESVPSVPASPCHFASSELVLPEGGMVTAAAGSTVSITERLTNTTNRKCSIETNRCDNAVLLDTNGVLINTGPVVCTAQSILRELGPGDSYTFTVSVRATVPPGTYSAQVSLADGSSALVSVSLDDRIAPCPAGTVTIRPNGTPALRTEPIRDSAVSVLITGTAPAECTARIARSDLSAGDETIATSAIGRWFAVGPGVLIDTELTIGKIDPIMAPATTLGVTFDDGETASTPLAPGP